MKEYSSRKTVWAAQVPCDCTVTLEEGRTVQVTKGVWLLFKTQAARAPYDVLTDEVFQDTYIANNIPTGHTIRSLPPMPADSGVSEAEMYKQHARRKITFDNMGLVHDPKLTAKENLTC